MAKDKYHDAVVNALEKEGWKILESPYTLLLPERRIYIDLLTEHQEQQAIVIEIKTFENMDSPINYLANTLGQYFLYKAGLDFMEDRREIYLAIPIETYMTLFQEVFVAHVIEYNQIKLLVYNPIDEVIVKWNA
jgi:Holliday junction resolvase-like predicted endonuclease